MQQGIQLTVTGMQCVVVVGLAAGSEVHDGLLVLAVPDTDHTHSSRLGCVRPVSQLAHRHGTVLGGEEAGVIGCTGGG